MTIVEKFQSPGKDNNNLRAIKDLSLKPRFLHNYGADEQLYQESREYIKYWHDKLFHIDEESFISEVASGNLKIKHTSTVEAAFNPPQLEVVPIDSIGLQNSIDLTIEMNSKQQNKLISFQECVDLNAIGRKGLVINSGGLVTSMKWLNKSDEVAYLAAAVIYHENASSIVDERELGIFYTGGGKELQTGIQIWIYDDASNNLALYKSYDTTAFGACSNISWAPFSMEDPEVIGVLGGNFKDGKLHFLQIAKHLSEGTEAAKVIESSFHYQLINARSSSEEPLPITSYDYLGTDRVIVGTSDGSIAEFVFPFVEDNFSVPSFIHNVLESPITFVTVAHPIPDKYLIQVNSFSNQNLVLDYNDFRVGRLVTFPTTVQPQYNPALRVFVFSDSNDSVGYTFVRHPHDRPSLILKPDGMISSSGVSQVLGHPLVLVGNTYGEIYVLNIARKIFAITKTTNKLLVPLRLWKLQYKGEKSFVLNGDYVSIAVEKSNKVTVSPEDLIISSLNWNENLAGSSIYTAATYSGLIILEKLQK